MGDTTKEKAAAEYAGQNEALGSVFKYWCAMAEMGIIRLFIQHKIFDAFPTDGDIAISELAMSTGAQPALLERFAGCLVACGVLASASPSRVSLTEVSKGYRGVNRATLLLNHAFDYFLLPAAHWPEYFADGLAEPQSSDRVPISLAMGHPEASFYDLIQTMPEKATAFNRTMAAAALSMPATGYYDFGWIGEQAAAPGDRPLFVDVAGGKGQALKAILAETPQIPADRCVLFDRADVIEDAEREDDEQLRRVRKVPGSFFDVQPVTGGLVYHIRRALNDWPDRDAAAILGRLRDACAPDSRILISETLLLSPPTPSNSVLDIFFMNIGGKRRNERMYRELAAQVGLTVTGIFRHDKSDAAMVEMMLA